MIKQCVVCYKNFKAQGKTKTCSAECSSKLHVQNKNLWQKNNRPHLRIYLKKWYSHYPLEKKGILRAKRRVYWHKRRLAVLIHYSGNPPKCAFCGEENQHLLQVDHVNNDGHEHRLELGRGGIQDWLIHKNFPDGFQILCKKCNYQKYLQYKVSK